MKLSNQLMVVFGWLLIWPQYQPEAQGTKETIRHIKEEMRTDSTKAKADSLIMVHDSLADFTSSIATKLKNESDMLPAKVDKLERSVDILARKDPDTVTVQRIKYVAVPPLVDKDQYYARQRKITDSLAQVKNDSIKKALRDRSLFRKILGLKPKKQKR